MGEKLLQLSLLAFLRAYEFKENYYRYELCPLKYHCIDYIVISKKSSVQSLPVLKISLYSGLINLSPDPIATCLALIIFSI